MARSPGMFAKKRKIGKSTAMRLEGLDDVLSAINRKIMKQYPEATLQGLLKYGVIVLADAQRRTPVDLGNLRHSGFIVWRKGSATPSKGRRFRGKGRSRMGRDHQIAKNLGKIRAVREGKKKRPGVMVGFSAHYAPFVHENVEASYNVGEAKFLEKAFQANIAEGLRLIGSEVKEQSRKK